MTPSDAIEELVRAAAWLAGARSPGALVAVERRDDLGRHAATGVALDARLSADLLASIFARGAALRDGAVVVRGARIVAAGCALPPSPGSLRDPAGRLLGMRHRAAAGLAAASDALVLAVSRRHAGPTLFERGAVHFDLDPARLRDLLEARLAAPAPRPAAERPPLLGLWHAALRVADLDRALAFYRDVVGLALEWRPDAENAYLTSGRDNLALHRADGPGLDHVGFALPTAEAVDAWAAYLAAHGHAPEQAPRTHRDGARSLYVRDPAGHLVQFIHHPPIVRAGGSS